jgi:hypothetical protein
MRYVKLLNLKNKNFTLLLLGIITTFSLSMVIYADILEGTRTLNSGKYVEIYYDSSIANNGYSQMFHNARSAWSGISTQMKGFSLVTQNTDYSDEAYVANTSTAGLWGMTFPKKYILNVQVSAGLNDNWDFCEVYVYKNQMDAYNLTNIQRQGVAVHELGHSAKLNHPQSVYCVMSEGVPVTWPNDYDKYELKRKWGD